jgi:trehalose 6-phosphate phosphatase
MVRARVKVTFLKPAARAIGTDEALGYVFCMTDSKNLNTSPAPDRSKSPDPALDLSLFLDVDGTLLELTETPSATRVDEALKVLLGEVAERLGGAVALVSGRSIAYLDAMFTPLKLPTAGLHGVERRKASGDIQGASYVDARLDAARATLALFVQRHPGTLLEDKDRSLAVHFRMAPDCESSVRQAVAAAAKPMGTNYQIQEGKMVLEIKPSGFTKGTAVREFIQEPPFSGRRPVFVGDDLTDRGGFEAVEAFGGISIAVGDRIKGQWRLENPRAVRRWLEEIAALTDTHRA